jgi:hypothetical protein
MRKDRPGPGESFSPTRRRPLGGELAAEADVEGHSMTHRGSEEGVITKRGPEEPAATRRAEDDVEGHSMTQRGPEEGAITKRGPEDASIMHRSQEQGGD